MMNSRQRRTKKRTPLAIAKRKRDREIRIAELRSWDEKNIKEGKYKLPTEDGEGE